jgi:predicted Zn-ribbon and HTH transcriptional regulator
MLAKIQGEISGELRVPVGTKLECKRCPHKWTQRGHDPPTQCPKCKSPYWNRIRIVDLEGELAK